MRVFLVDLRLGRPGVELREELRLTEFGEVGEEDGAGGGGHGGEHRGTTGGFGAMPSFVGQEDDSYQEEQGGNRGGGRALGPHGH